jgi:3-hydroxyisobutyrate dehydrogenase-like beta-hydroxyacid dehydrogenase
MDVGVISLGTLGPGTLGRQVAETFLRPRTHAVFIFARSGLPADLTAEGAYFCVFPQLVARRAAVVFVACDDEASLEGCLFDSGGVMDGLNPGQGVVSVGLDPFARSGEFAKHIAGAGGHYLEAIVNASAGSVLTYGLRGPLAVFERYEPCFRQLGPRVRYDGPIVHAMSSASSSGFRPNCHRGDRRLPATRRMAGRL